MSSYRKTLPNTPHMSKHMTEEERERFDFLRKKKLFESMYKEKKKNKTLRYDRLIK